MLLAIGVKLEKMNKLEKEKKHGLCAIAYQNIFQELYLEDKKGTPT